MVFFNHATRQMTTKIVYYGPGLCGKTTNLNTIYARTAQKARGEMVSLNTETDRTLFFDLLPLEVGMVGGFKAKLQLYTVPGQVFYNSTRKLVLKGVDGIVFVADSQVPMLDANKESLQNLSDNLKELGLHLEDIPMVFQWNKRDLKNIVPVEVLEAELNPKGHLSFQTIAQDGTGVFETLRGITKLALAHIKTNQLGETAVGKGPLSPEPLAAAPHSAPPKQAPPAPPLAPMVPDLPVAPALPVAPKALQASEFSMPASFETPAPAPLPEALSFLDLPNAKDLFRDEAAPVVVPQPHVEAPVAKAGHGTVQVMAPLTVKLWPPQARVGGAAPGQPKVFLKPLAPAVASRVQAVAPRTPVALPSPLKAPAAAPVLRLVLPPGTSEGELEVLVVVRQHGVVLTEHTMHRPAPAHGSVGHLAIEIKGS